MPNSGRRFWCAHARGPNFDLLAKRGFVHFYPTMDDYVFLEVKPENQVYLRKQTELGIAFMKHSNQYVTISEAELQEMGVTTTYRMQVGTRITSLIGTCENMEGEVLELKGDEVLCRMEGYNRTYDRLLKISQIVPSHMAPEKKDEDFLDLPCQ